MNILIARPPINGMSFCYEDLGLSIVTSVLRNAGHKCSFFDGMQMNLTDKAFINYIIEADEPVVCITIHAEEWADDILHMATRIKRRSPDKILILGGHPVSSIDSDIFKKYPNSFDFLVRGDGEDTIVELLQHLSEGHPSLRSIDGISYKDDHLFIRTRDRLRATEYSSLPFPARDVWSNGHKKPLFGSMLSYYSRGCNHRCKFCSVATHYGTSGSSWHSRSVDSFIQELIHLCHEYNQKDYTFVDPNFLGDPKTNNKHVETICDAINNNNLNITWEIAFRPGDYDDAKFELMYEAGLRRVLVGLESGTKSMLDEWGKGLTPALSLDVANKLARIGIYMEVGFIMLTPDTTIENIKKNISFLRKLPYFGHDKIYRKLSPLHKTQSALGIDHALLSKSSKRLYPTYTFKDIRVCEYYRVCNIVESIVAPYLDSIYLKLRKNIPDDSGIIKRYHKTTHELLKAYLDFLDGSIIMIINGNKRAKIDNYIDRWATHNIPFYEDAASSFK